MLFIRLTVPNKHLFSLIAPTQPQNPTNVTNNPAAMRIEAGIVKVYLPKNSLNLPGSKSSQIPTPTAANPASYGKKIKNKKHEIQPKKRYKKYIFY